MSNLKKRIFEIIQIGNRTDTLSKLFDIFIIFIIGLSISVTFLQTFDELNNYRTILNKIEFFTILIFIIEYILRIWTSCYLYPNKSYFKSIILFSFSFYGIVDLLAIISYFIPFLFSNGAVALKMLRVVRIMKLFQINATYDAFNVITDVLKDKKNQIISSIFMIVVLMFASSMCMYSLEHDAQPESFRNAFSGIWWSVSTLLTVGYGDIYPITVGGKIMAIIIAFLGVGMVAIPTGIISAGFVEYYTKIKTGNYANKNADFVTLDIFKDNPFINKKIKEISLPEGLYVAVLIRDDDIYTPYGELIIKENDCLLLASNSIRQIDSKIEEIKLNPNHSWIGKTIKTLDISRQTFIVMIKRKNKNIEPKGNTLLKENDVVIILDKRKINKE